MREGTARAVSGLNLKYFTVFVRNNEKINVFLSFCNKKLSYFRPKAAPATATGRRRGSGSKLLHPSDNYRRDGISFWYSEEYLF